MKLSVIITTYNRPEFLQLVLASYLSQEKIDPTDWEIIIADDGSDEITRRLIESYQAKSSIAIHHVWQEDQGFRAAQIRNKAAAIAKGRYIIFTDGDCMAPQLFVYRHLQLAKPNYFVAGNRILLSKNFTESLQQEAAYSLCKNHFFTILKHRIQGHCNRFIPTLYLPFYPRFRVTNKLKGVKTCNLALWRADLIKVNGFDEAYQGWGYEDSDLTLRLFHAGIKRLDGRFATHVFHLWHPENDRQNQQKNWARLMERHKNAAALTINGIDQYLDSDTH